MSDLQNYAPSWHDDVLNRSNDAKFLTSYLNNLYGDSTTDKIYSDSFVLCINAEWGYGKTFLVEKWERDLREKLQHPVVYFDAWKNDFSEDPLVAFISELEAVLEKYKGELPLGNDAVRSVVKMGKAAIVPAIKTAANILVKKVAGSDLTEIADIYESVSDASIEAYVDEAVNTHKKRKQRINDFSKELAELLKKLEGTGKYKLPMYVFIDELDRCRPSYAIQLLEAIKHIFGTKGVFFIVATNKLQLSHSIKAIYGSEFDSLAYLQRFFDQEYKLSRPDYEKFSKTLIEKYRLESLQIVHLGGFDLNEIFSTLAACFDLSLRAQDQVAKQLNAIKLTKSLSGEIHGWFLIFLMMFKTKNENKYNNFLLEKNSNTQFQIIKECFSFDHSIGAMVDASGDFESGKKSGSVKVIAIIQEYLRIENLNLLELRPEIYAFNSCRHGMVNAIKNAFRSELPLDNISDGFYPLSIAKYKNVVDKAGSIS